MLSCRPKFSGGNQTVLYRRVTFKSIPALVSQRHCFAVIEWAHPVVSDRRPGGNSGRVCEPFAQLPTEVWFATSLSPCSRWTSDCLSVLAGRMGWSMGTGCAAGRQLGRLAFSLGSLAGRLRLWVCESCVLHTAMANAFAASLPDERTLHDSRHRSYSGNRNCWNGRVSVSYKSPW